MKEERILLFENPIDYEKLLKLLSNKLNLIHSTNHSHIFWRILIGPWLGSFLHVFFERWKNVETSFHNHKINHCIFLNLKEDIFTPSDHKEFTSFALNDLWNQFIYQNIIVNFISNKKIIFKDYPVSKQLKELKIMPTGVNFKKNIYNELDIFKKITSYLLNTFDKKKYKYFFYKTYLGSLNESILSASLGQMPIFSIIDSDSLIKSKKNNKLREKLKNIFVGKNNFEKALAKIFSLQFPLVFLENYSQLEKFSTLGNIPKSPKIIFTSNAAWYDTKIAYHIAKLKEKKVKLYYGQHGGAYGLSKIHWPEMHEKIISDKYLTWGWAEKKTKKIIKFGMLKKIKFNKNKFFKKNLLMTLKVRQKYFISMDSSTGTEMFSDYMKDCSGFLLNLSKEIKSSTIVRLPYISSKIRDTDFYSNLEKNFNFYNEDTIQEAYSKSKLVIHTSNSTPFLETLSENIPTILILNKKTNPVTSFAKKYIEKLYDSNIIFDNPIKAANFVNTIWENDIEKWWYKNNNQYAVKTFNNFFAKKEDNIVKEIKNIIKIK